MKWNRLMALALVMSLGAALFVWRHAQAKAHKVVTAALIQPVPDGNPSLTLTGILFPVITTPLSGRHVNLAVPLNTWVKQGEVIGTAESQTDPGERDRAWQEVMAARSAEQIAQDEIREDEEQLCTLQSQAGRMDREEVAAEVAESDAQRDYERQNTLFRSGLASRFDYNAAATARDSSEAAVSSIRSKLAESAIEIDEWQAKALAAETALREAAMRRNAAEALVGQWQGAPIDGAVISPADGIILASGDSVGIASDPRQVSAHVMVRAADLVAITVGRQAQIVFIEHPAVTLAGKVAAIAETPTIWSDGAYYEVVFVADNPTGAWLSGAAVHVHLLHDLPH